MEPVCHLRYMNPLMLVVLLQKSVQACLADFKILDFKFMVKPMRPIISIS